MSGQLCADDLVARKDSPSSIGVVERTCTEVETHEPFPGQKDGGKVDRDVDIPRRAFHQFLDDGVPPKGTVYVRWRDSSEPELIPESKLVLLDRSLLIGDVVKKNASEAMSGVVINTITKCVLQPMCDVTLRGDAQRSDPQIVRGLPPLSGADSFEVLSSVQRPPWILDVPSSELAYAESPAAEDLVIYKDWVGRVNDCLTAITLKLSDNGVVEISEEDAEHLNFAFDVFCLGDIVRCKKGVLRNGKWIYGKYSPNTIPIGTVVAVRVVNASVEWLDRRLGGSGERASFEPPPVELERSELESSDFCIYDRTKKPPRTADPSTTTLSNSDIDIRINLRVRFRDLSGACVKYDGSNNNGKLSRLDRRETLGYDLNLFDVVDFRTDAEIQWQDLSITREHSVDLVPELAIDDEHNAWPTELVHPVELEAIDPASHTQQTKKVGVVQRVNPADRMAEVRWCPESFVKYSVDPTVAGAPKSLVERAVHPADGQVEEVSLYDVEAPGELNVRRGDLALLLHPPNDTSDSGRSREWLGEIVDTKLDGTLTVRLGAASPVRDIDVRREDIVVAVRSDGTDDMDWEAADNLGQSVRINSDGEVEIFDDDDSMSGIDEEDYWSDDIASDEEEAEAHYEDENGVPLNEDDVNDDQWESDSDDAEMHDAPEETPPTSHSVTPAPNTTTQKGHSVAAPPTVGTLSPGLDQYAILSSPPPTSHAFFNEPLSSMPGHMKRTAKEHRILSTAANLPSGVYVRTWESRLDLLRVLLIGPTDTPYADAPFIVDFHLPPSFPTEPPQAFFHSWKAPNGLGGVGRVNPNLYEDGKICLSLLGTWDNSGKGSTDGWNASRSTLLQVIVSLLGLVLVKEPYFNEAGYESLAGLESSRRASELYSERAYLKARTFILTALNENDGEGSARGVEGLEDVLEWAFRSPTGLRLLEKNIKEMEAVLSRNEGDGVGGVSKGAKIMLARILEKMKEIPRR